MPYDIRKQGDQWCVIKRTDGESMGCHDTEKGAHDQRRAILANEAKEADSLLRNVFPNEYGH